MKQALSPETIKEIVTEATKLMPEADYVCDLSDLSFVWAGEHALEVTGYTEDDSHSLKNIEVLDKDSHNEESYRKELMERVAQKSGETEFVIKHKNGGKLKVRVQFSVFEFKEAWYIVGKILRFNYIQEQ